VLCQSSDWQRGWDRANWYVSLYGRQAAFCSVMERRRPSEECQIIH